VPLTGTDFSLEKPSRAGCQLSASTLRAASERRGTDYGAVTFAYPQSILASQHSLSFSRGLVKTRVFGCILFLAALSCAGGATSSGSFGGSQSPTGRSRDVITREELSASDMQAQSVLDAVRSLRPQFLNSRGQNSHSDPEAGQVHVSIDDGRIGPISDLSLIHVSGVIEIRLLNVAQAMQRFGGAAREGPVIVVKTRE
jgi:hypothetical protein